MKTEITKVEHLTTMVNGAKQPEPMPSVMKTEITTTEYPPIHIEWHDIFNALTVECKNEGSRLPFTRTEAIQLRDFLIQLNLDKDEN